MLGVSASAAGNPSVPSAIAPAIPKCRNTFMPGRIGRGRHDRGNRARKEMAAKNLLHNVLYGVKCDDATHVAQQTVVA